MKRRALLLMATMAAALIVASGVALAETVTCNITPPCYGTPEADTINGTANGETIYAYGGIDHVFAGGGDDTVYGSSGSDRVLEGEEGSDTIYGGGGNDQIIANFSGDAPGSIERSFGGSGFDDIAAADGRVDIIKCGKNEDRVAYDEALDTIKGCELKNPV